MVFNMEMNKTALVLQFCSIPIMLQEEMIWTMIGFLEDNKLINSR